MKNKWHKNLSLADDKYIEEADPNRIIKTKKSGWKIAVSLVAACMCMVFISCNLWLFVPFNTNPPDVSQYSGSEYYGIIQQLNVLTYKPPKYKNNAEKILGVAKSLFSFTLKGGAMDNTAMAPTSPDFAEGSDNYQEITDNQVSGIIEADRIKRSDTHIYYLDGSALRIYSIDKENTAEVGSYDIKAVMGDYYTDSWEFYLSNDCKTVTVITQDYAKYASNQNRFIRLISLDVSDPSNIVKKAEFSITGSYMSSRKVNGDILLLTEFVINTNELDFDNEATFLPQINDGDGERSIPAECIVSPETLNSTRYTVVMKLDEDTLELLGTAAYLSYSEDVYVSNDHVFLTRVFADKKDNGNGTLTRNSMTEISCLTYGGESFEKKGSVIVRGYVKDQWSMDEHEGILRVVTTTNSMLMQERNDKNHTYYSAMISTETGIFNASLYCVDLSTFEVVASVVDFAPPNEQVQSVRFNGDMAYVCTSIERSDPVFFFDLSDLNNITYKDTGTIEGFSTSLINFGNGYLIGIGTGAAWGSFKIEVYEETEDGVRSVDAYEIQYAEYSTNYKSYYVDRENQLIGVGVWDNSHYNGRCRYILLTFDGYELIELINASLEGKPANMRGVYIDGYMYMFGQKDFKVEKVFE